jgi:hypothetical protein
VEDSGEWWKEHLRITSEEAECSGFCATVEDSGGWWKEYPVSRLKRWNAVDSAL